jgi:hypothetical protein
MTSGDIGDAPGDFDEFFLYTGQFSGTADDRKAKAIQQPSNKDYLILDGNSPVASTFERASLV